MADRESNECNSKKCKQKCRNRTNHQKEGKHTIQWFTRATDHTCVFDMACVSACECDRMPFPSRPVVSINVDSTFFNSVNPNVDVRNNVSTLV